MRRALLVSFCLASLSPFFVASAEIKLTDAPPSDIFVGDEVTLTADKVVIWTLTTGNLASDITYRNSFTNGGSAYGSSDILNYDIK